MTKVFEQLTIRDSFMFDYINEGSISDMFTESLDSSARDIRSNERWKREYMHNFTERQDIWEEAYEEGIAQGEKRGEKRGIELGEKRGIKLGIEKGIEQGIAQGIERGVEQMLRAGRTPEQIAEFCGYELDKVKKIQQKLSVNA